MVHQSLLCDVTSQMRHTKVPVLAVVLLLVGHRGTSWNRVLEELIGEGLMSLMLRCHIHDGRLGAGTSLGACT